LFIALALHWGMALLCCSSRPSRARDTGAGGSVARGGSRRFPPHLGRCCRVTASPGAGCTAVAPTPTSASATATATHANAGRNQFRYVGRGSCDESRQQFPGAPGGPGDIRLRQRPAEQSGRRRCLRSNGRATFPDLGGGLRNFGQDRRAGRFRRRPASVMGRRRGVGRAPCARRQCRRFG
jgi:hypothetical protein